MSVGNTDVVDALEEGDLISRRDDGGALHLALAWMDYPAYRSESEGGYNPKDGFHVSYFSDHPGASVRRSDARAALDDLRRLTWYLVPFRHELERSKSFNARSRAAVDEVLGRLPVTEFLTAHTGEACPRSGRWIMRGTDRAIEIGAGEPLPGHAYFANYPPQWTRWDLPLG